VTKRSGNGAAREETSARKPEPWRYQLDLQQLEILTKIVETGSFSKAATAVYLTQPTVSTHIATLERTFGLRLLDRMGRRTKPTAAGRVVYSYAKKMLALRAQAVEEVDLLLGLVRGELAIAGSTIPGTYLLPAHIGAFVESHPEVRIHLHLAASDAVVDLVAAGDAELGITGTKPRHPEIASEPFGEDEIVLVAAPSLPIARERRVTPKGLGDVPMVAREPGSGTQRTAEEALRRAGVAAASLKIACRLGSSEAVREGACAGIGAAFLSRRAAEAEIRAGRLRAVEVEGLKLRRPFHLVRPRRRDLSPLGRAFHAHLKSRGPA
jgi:DNA-binding transcriptional LysR family regulator